VPSLKRQPDGKAEALFLDSLVPGATLAAGPAEGADRGHRQAADSQGHDLSAGAWRGRRLPARLDQRELRAPGARPGGAARRRGGAGVGARPARRPQHARPPLRGGGAEITLRDADHYAAQLRDEGAVIASFAERRAEIVRQLAAAAAAEGATPIDDEACSTK
jgi:glycyl-tRNA synthetase beta chain